MITILCSGSRGDIQPYIALAIELQRLGKEVRIAAGKSFEGFIKGYGVSVYPISADLNSVEIDPKLLKSAQSSDNPLKMLLTFNKMKRYAVYMTDDMFKACEGSNLIIYHPGCTIGYYAAKLLNIPAVIASPFPLHKTKEFASVIAYGRSKMPTGMSYTLLQSMLWTASKLGVKGCLKQRLGRLPKDFGCPLERVDSTHPAVISCSNYVFNRPQDWDSNIHQYGYWFLAETPDYTPPKELVAFLESGEKPIYFGFGSVFRDDEKARFIKVITKALSLCGRRGIICGMGEINDLPDSIISVLSIPHSWLFNKVLAVCHHGGAGTTAEGFRAGVPSIIIPFSNDQFAWAHRAHHLGVGAPPLNKKTLTADTLSKAIQLALSKEVVDNANQLGRMINKENGAQDCAKIIVETLNQVMK